MNLVEKVLNANENLEKLFTLWANDARNKKAGQFRPASFYVWVKNYLSPEEEKEIHKTLRALWNRKVSEGVLVKSKTDCRAFVLSKEREL